MGKFKTHEQFCDEIFEKFNDKITVLGLYSGNRIKISFKCNICGNIWESTPFSILHTQSGCPKCADKIRAEKLTKKNILTTGIFIDVYPELAARIDKDKNRDINFKTLSCKSGKYIWWKCGRCGHSWKSKIAAIVNGKGNCPNCYLKNAYKGINTYRLKENGSFADSYPELLLEWNYEKNIGIDPYQLLIKSNQKVWWRCQHGHEWEAKISKRTGGTGCPYCVNWRRSKLQSNFDNYMQQFYTYEVLHEFNCTLRCRNPETNLLLPYDNEVILSDNNRLIVECQGEQHYKVTGFAKNEAKKHNVSSDEAFEYQKRKDKYKKDYAISNGYHYLELPYWTFQDNSYQTLIDTKIHEILLTTQN